MRKPPSISGITLMFHCSPYRTEVLPLTHILRRRLFLGIRSSSTSAPSPILVPGAMSTAILVAPAVEGCLADTGSPGDLRDRSLRGPECASSSSRVLPPPISCLQGPTSIRIGLRGTYHKSLLPRCLGANISGNVLAADLHFPGARN